ncbi:MAG: 1-phosphofructokinase [Clostridia bacterium]|nr:1-phosphofructokinase [Clostridia bacterium]
MIYTVTLNPSIDYIVHLDSLVKGITNRTAGEEYYYGGKGINVSCVLSELGTESIALGFTAGFTGEAIENGLKESGIRTDFIRLKNGISRINVKIKAEEESEINGQGPDIEEDEFDLLMQKIGSISAGDTLVLAGSVPDTLSGHTYERILEALDGRNVRTVVDASGQLLVRSLRYRPFLIKPNRQELSEIFGTEIADEEDVVVYAAKLQSMGAKNVIVSLGGDGAMLLDESGNRHRSGVLKEKVLNTVGAGDSMVAGFLAGYEQTGDYAYALMLGTACGNATAFSKGLAKKEKIDEILHQLQTK